LRNYVPIEEVSDQSDEYESFGETHELGRDLEDEEYHNQAAILAKKQEIEDLERYGRKISEREMSDLGSIKADERKNETLQRLYPEDNPQAFNKSMKGHLSSGEMIDHWEKRDFSKRNSVHKNYKLQKKKEAYRAARNIAEPRKGFFGKLKELFSEDDKSDKSEAA